MRRRGRHLRLLLAAASLALLGVDRPPGLGDVADVRFWSYPDYTRVVVELSHPVDVDVRQLPADPEAGRPERLYVDLPRTWVGRRYADGLPVSDGLLQEVRLGQNTLSRARLVIDLLHYQRHRLLVLSSPDRVVVDVYGPREDPEELRWPKHQRPAGRLPMDLRPIQTVVVDPGHGGRDPGAIGVGGVQEKAVNLDVALRLRDELRKRGFRVVMTRDDDRTLDLEERTAMAEAARGDLFVSVHANASPRRSTRGFEVYYLDAGHERHSLQVAARENGVPSSEVDSLQRTVARLRVSEASVHSGRLATLVHDSLMDGLGNRQPGLRDLGVKQGPFYVLFLSSMPSILVESGFLTNRSDAALLRDEGFRSRLAVRIADGLERFRDEGPRLASGGAK